jgi:hypothetical protein
VDIDGTIIGNIEPQLTEYQLIIQGPSHKKTRENQQSFRGKLFKDQLVMHLMNGLMRPGFSQFCAQCALMNIPVMLYTAAEHEWATFLAPRILQAVRLEMVRDLESPPVDFKFARLFTRRFCGVAPDGTCEKSLDFVIKHIHTTLRREFEGCRLEQLHERIIMIDNTEGILKQRRNLVLVPTYDYIHMYDVTANIDHTDSRRLARARQLLTNADDSFLGPRRAKELKTSLDAEGNFRFRTLFHLAISKAMTDHYYYNKSSSSQFENINKNTTAHHHHHHHHSNNTNNLPYDPLWRTLRNRLVAYLQAVKAQSDRNAYDLATYLAGHTSIKALTAKVSRHTSSTALKSQTTQQQ